MARRSTQLVKVEREPEPLSPQQEATITALLSGSTQQEAAEKAGVTPETVSRWMNGDAAFVATLNSRRAEVWQATRDTLAALRVQAVKTLAELLEDGDDATRLKAALSILKLTDWQPPTAPTSAEAIRVEWKRDEHDIRYRDMLFS